MIVINGYKLLVVGKHPPNVGDIILSRKGKRYTLLGADPPDGPGSTGRVLVKLGIKDDIDSFFPSEFHMFWEKIKPGDSSVTKPTKKGEA